MQEKKPTEHFLKQIFSNPLAMYTVISKTAELHVFKFTAYILLCKQTLQLFTNTSESFDSRHFVILRKAGCVLTLL